MRVQRDAATERPPKRAMRYGRWSAIVASPMALCLLAGCGQPGIERRPPNIVLVIADDQGYGDYGFMGSDVVETPNLDALAAEGAVFRQGYTTSSVCTPSLRTLLTGLYPLQWNARVEELRRQDPALEEISAIDHFETLPRMLGRAGYASFQAGKYWERDYRAAGFTAGTTEEYDPESRWGGPAARKLGRESIESVYQFIDARENEPFFLWFAPMLPHIPHDAPAEFLRLYASKPLTRSLARYYANCSRLDHVVGKLVEHLEERGLWEDTLLVYLSDNGWVQPRVRIRGSVVQAHLGGDRGKASLYDPGFRTPIVVRMPGVVPPGRVFDALVSIADVVPTILDYAGVEPTVDLPGQSLRPLIEGRAAPRREMILGSMALVRNDSDLGPDAPRTFEEDSFFVRTPRQHFILREERGTAELYDIVSDPEERRNLAEERPDDVAKFKREIARWRAALARDDI